MQKALKKTERRIETLTDFWNAANITSSPSWGGRIRLSKTPFAHQVLDLNHLACHARSGLFNDPGLGKTLPSQAHVLWLVGLGNKAVCVMPPVLVQQFRDSFHANFPGVEAHVKIEMFQGDVKQRDLLIQGWNQSGWPDVLIMSFDMFSGKSAAEIKSLVTKRRKSAEKKGLCPEQASILSPADEANQTTWLAKGYNHLLLDEATAVKTPSSDLHKAVKQFAGPDGAESNGLVLMTGSPVENNLTDLYGLIKLITPKRYATFRSFERMHCVMTYGRFPKLVGFQNQDYAYQSLYLHGRRVTKKEAIDLPPRLVSEIQIHLAPKHLELYKRLATERVLEIGEKVIDATTASSLYVKSQRMLLCPESFHDSEAHGEWKVENTLLTALDELVHSLGGRKLLLFCWFTESVRKLCMRYSHLNPATLYGEVTGNEREQMKAKFINDNACRLMIANPRSGGVGVDMLQTVCSHVAFIEPIGIPGLFEQALSRVHRTGQKAESINVYLFTAMQTVAVKLRNDLARKERDANSVVRDAKTLLTELMGAEGIQGSLD